MTCHQNLRQRESLKAMKASPDTPMRPVGMPRKTMMKPKRKDKRTWWARFMGWLG